MMRSITIALLITAGPVICPGQDGGVAAEWDVRANMDAFVADVRKVEPLLKWVNVDSWVKEGAPSAYQRQLQTSKSAVQQLVAATEKLATDPEKLQAALDAYFELERMELLLNSLREGVRKYQSPDLANQFTQVLGLNILHRDRLRQHIRDLSTTREQEYAIANQEAQRCRGMILRQTPPQTQPNRRPNRSRAVR